jgi:hypothetical protein
MRAADEVASWAVGACDHNDLTRRRQYASPSVYAKGSCPAGCPRDLLGLLHGPHRIGYRLVMILLSQQGWSAATIAELLGSDPRTVRRWVHRYNHQGINGLADRPRAGRPRLGSPRLAARILGKVGDVHRFPTRDNFASANGTAPIPVSSGRTDRYRLNRGGNRRLNRAL